MHTRNLSALIAVTLAKHRSLRRDDLRMPLVQRLDLLREQLLFAAQRRWRAESFGSGWYAVRPANLQLVQRGERSGGRAQAEDEARWAQSSPTSKEIECKQIDQAIAQKDSQLRQPHSAQWGDHLTAERKKR